MFSYLGSTHLYFPVAIDQLKENVKTIYLAKSLQVWLFKMENIIIIMEST